MGKIKEIIFVFVILIVSLSCQALTNFSNNNQPSDIPSTTMPTPTILVDTPIPPLEEVLIAYIEKGDIWLVDPDGGNKRELTSDGEYDNLAWSPNGQALLLINRADQGLAQQLFIKDLSQEPAEKVADDVTVFAWNLQGEKLAYYADQIYIFDVTTGKMEITIPVEDAKNLFWSFDGKALLYYSYSNGGIHSVNLSTLEDTVVYSSDRLSNFSELDYSPQNGYFLAWLYASEGSGTTAIITPGGDLIKLVEDVAGVPTADWSPDGKYVVYKAWWEYASKDVEDSMHVVVADTATTLFSIPDNGINPRWSPDSRIIAYTTRQGGINLMNVETQEITHLLPDAPDSYLEENCGFSGVCGGYIATEDNEPEWSPDGLKIIQQYKTGFYIVDIESKKSQWFEGGTSPDWLPSEELAVSLPPLVNPSLQSDSTEIPSDTPTSAPVVTQISNAEVSITVNDTKKGDFLKINFDGQEYEIGPLEKGAYAISPNNKFFVYCTNSGSCYAAKFGSKNLDPIGSVGKDFSIIMRKENPQYEFSFLDDNPYSVQIFELIMKQDKILQIPTYITSSD